MDFIFDLDGTLLDSAPAIRHCLRMAALEVAPAHAERASHVAIGPPLAVMIEWIFGAADDERAPGFLASFKRLYDTAGVEMTGGFPGAGEALALLAAGPSRLSIVSNKRALPTERILNRLGWSGYFCAVRCADSLGCVGLDKSARLAALLPGMNDSAMVGDTLEDYEAAASNGIDFVAADYGYAISRQAFASVPALRRLAVPQQLVELAGLRR